MGGRQLLSNRESRFGGRAQVFGVSVITAFLRAGSQRKCPVLLKVVSGGMSFDKLGYLLYDVCQASLTYYGTY